MKMGGRYSTSCRTTGHRKRRWAAHNLAIQKTVEPSTAGVRRRIVSTDKRRRQDIRSDRMA